MNTFIIRNNPSFVRYIKRNWRYFINNKSKDGVKITIRKNSVFIHISIYYCVICNDLKYIQRNPILYNMEATKKSLNWLEKYGY